MDSPCQNDWHKIAGHAMSECIIPIGNNDATQQGGVRPSLCEPQKLPGVPKRYSVYATYIKIISSR